MQKRGESALRFPSKAVAKSGGKRARAFHQKRGQKQGLKQGQKQGQKQWQKQWQKQGTKS